MVTWLFWNVAVCRDAARHAGLSVITLPHCPSSRVQICPVNTCWLMTSTANINTTLLLLNNLYKTNIIIITIVVIGIMYLTVVMSKCYLPQYLRRSTSWSVERETIMGSGQQSQRGPGVKPWSGGQEGNVPWSWDHFSCQMFNRRGTISHLIHSLWCGSPKANAGFRGQRGSNTWTFATKCFEDSDPWSLAGWTSTVACASAYKLTRPADDNRPMMYEWRCLRTREYRSKHYVRRPTAWNADRRRENCEDAALHACLVRCAASTVGQDWINSDTGNKCRMICIEYASSVSMPHLLRQQLLTFSASTAVSSRLLLRRRVE